MTSAAGDRDRHQLFEVLDRGEWRRERVCVRVDIVKSPNPDWGGGQEKRMFVYFTERLYVNGEPVEVELSGLVRFRDDDGELREVDHGELRKVDRGIAERLWAAHIRRVSTDWSEDEYRKWGFSSEGLWRGFRRPATNAMYQRRFGLNKPECERVWREELQEAWKAQIGLRLPEPGSKDYNQTGIIGRK
jgi:hypothetical protein